MPHTSQVGHKKMSFKRITNVNIAKSFVFVFFIDEDNDIQKNFDGSLFNELMEAEINFDL